MARSRAAFPDVRMKTPPAFALPWRHRLAFVGLGMAMAFAAGAMFP